MDIWVSIEIWQFSLGFQVFLAFLLCFFCLRNRVESYSVQNCSIWLSIVFVKVFDVDIDGFHRGMIHPRPNYFLISYYYFGYTKWDANPAEWVMKEKTVAPLRERLSAGSFLFLFFVPPASRRRHRRRRRRRRRDYEPHKWWIMSRRIDEERRAA